MWVTFGCLLSGICSGWANDLFKFAITINDSTTYRNSNSDIRKILDLFEEDELRSLFKDYTPRSPLRAVLDVRGLDAIVSYDANSSILRLAIPKLGLDVRFPGQDREESQDLLEEWLKGLYQLAGWASSAQLTDLLQGAVRYSPVDPVAGNPNSLQSMMVASDYERATQAP